MKHSGVYSRISYVCFDLLMNFLFLECNTSTEELEDEAIKTWSKLSFLVARQNPKAPICT